MFSNEEKSFLKSYFVYLIIFQVLILTGAFISNSDFSQHVARNWLMGLVFVSMPLTHNLRTLKALIVNLPALGGTVFLQGLVSYDIYGDIELHKGMLILSIVYYCISAFIAWLVVRLFNKDFNLMGPAKNANTIL